MNAELRYPSLLDHIPDDNFLFAVLETNTQAFYQVIMEHYFEFRHYYKPQFNSIDIDYEDNRKWNLFEGLDIVYISEDYVDVELQSKQLLTQIHKLLKCGYMILTYINQYHISAYPSYHKYNGHHTMMVGEYLEKEDVFICQDYYRGRYATASVHSDELIMSIKTSKETGCTQNLGLVAIKKKENYTYNFRPAFFLKALQGMLNTDFYADTPSCGLGLFEAEKWVLQNNSPIWRPNTFRGLFQLVYDNVELMKYRTRYLCKECNWDFEAEAISACCNEIQKKCLQYHNSFLKIEIRDTSESITIPKTGFDIDKFMLYLGEIQHEYISVIEKLIEITKTNLNPL